MQRCSLLIQVARSGLPVRTSSILRAHLRAPQYGRHTYSTTPATGPTTPPPFHDVVIVGGGPVGLSLLNALRAQPSTSHLSIALVDASPLKTSTSNAVPSISTDYSNRCVSLTPASVRLLNDIGAWAHFDKTRVKPYERMNVWDGVSGAKINFDWAGAGVAGSPMGEELGVEGESDRTIAYMAEVNSISSALLARAKEFEALTGSLGETSIIDNTTVSGIALGDDDGEWDMRSWPVVSLSNGQTIAARLLIGADGANSPVRTFAGIESHGWDYERMGVVATLKLAATYNESAVTAYQRFLPSGPLAMLPLPNGYASLVWSTLPKYAAHLKTLSTRDMTAMINAGFRLSTVDLEYMHTTSSGQDDELDWRLQHTPFDKTLVPPMVENVMEGSVAAFPLKMRHADTYTGERVALVGDAAHTVHPLAGQGLNSGLLDVRALSEVIGDAAAAGSDIGSTLSLENYNARRYAANHALLGVCDKLHKVFSWSSGPVVWGRSLGFGAVDAIKPVKEFLMRRAAGS